MNIQELFTIESIHQQVKDQQQSIPNNVKIFKKILASKKVPEVGIGPHCSSPYECDFMGHCWKHIPEYSIFSIAYLRSEKKFQLYENGVISFEHITDEIVGEYLNDRQSMQVTAELENRTYIDKDSITKFISEIKYPLYFLDFETMMPAIPLYDNERPFQQVVFQYSLHLIEKRNNQPKHFEFLAEPEDGDPRIGFINQLIKDCGAKGDILTYNVSFERSRLNELVRDFPKYASKLQPIIHRLKDLMTPFKEYWYYSPVMKGSYSIKYVLPALVPELSYKNLEIQEGGTASAVYAEMAAGCFKGDVEKTKKALLDYCKLDTFAMVKIFEKLENI